MPRARLHVAQREVPLQRVRLELPQPGALGVQQRQKVAPDLRLLGAHLLDLGRQRLVRRRELRLQRLGPRALRCARRLEPLLALQQVEQQRRAVAHAGRRVQLLHPDGLQLRRLAALAPQQQLPPPRVDLVPPDSGLQLSPPDRQLCPRGHAGGVGPEGAPPLAPARGERPSTARAPARRQRQRQRPARPLVAAARMRGRCQGRGLELAHLDVEGAIAQAPLVLPPARSLALVRRHAVAGRWQPHEERIPLQQRLRHEVEDVAVAERDRLGRRDGLRTRAAALQAGGPQRSLAGARPPLAVRAKRERELPALGPARHLVGVRSLPVGLAEVL
eukprot:CAMPEP_0202782564 /NCGR_PEP_ID=MMETSP1388-20130828/62855_1 /ASSEMBLY_ACC=CAM_ASM_000864 /TAXON_ID=37098 /ORGANISM="Isochrysis sp, Strain CCMP1244" /LENGTH=331 /DNA_ID=CAMNT_0049452013 /DNA_START=49 /DNA_END=1040 /DNA_ORIENTATION=+